jgi:predicted metalloendopeptidase
VADTNPLRASSWDDSIPVADDFNHHVNATWLTANPVPPEYPMWGAYIELDHNNKELTFRLLEEAAASEAVRDPRRRRGRGRGGRVILMCRRIVGAGCVKTLPGIW